MKHTNLLYWTVLVVLSFGLALTACGGSEAPTPTMAPTPTPGPPTETPTPKPPTATPTPSASDHVKQGLEYYEQGELDKAMAEFDKAIELEPDNVDAHRNLGTVYGEQGKWEESAAAYEQAIELAPDFGEAYGDIVAAYIKLGKLEEAAAAGEKAIELAPDYATAHNNLGVAYKQQDRLDEAIAEYQEAIQLDPAYAMPHYNLGLVYYAQGKLKEAITEWEETTRLDPDYATAHKNMGVAYRELGMADEAVAEFEAYLQLAPDAPDRASAEEEITKLQKPTIENLLLSPPAPDIVANFTAYQNPTIGLSFQYPNDWGLDEQGNSVVVASHPDLFDGLDAGETGVQVRINATTLDEWGVSGAAEGLDRFIGGMSQDAILDGPSEIQINGQPAVAVLLRMETADVPQSAILAVIEKEDRLAVAVAAVSLEMEAQLFPTMTSIVASVEMIGAAEEETELPPGNSIKFSDSLKAGDDDGFFFLSPGGGALLVTIEPEAGLDVIVELQDVQSGAVLITVNESSGQESLVYKVPDGGLMYKIVVRGVDGAGGKYDASFIGSSGIGFDLLPSYMVAGRLPEGKSLSYIYTGTAGSTLHGLIIPHPDTPIDLIVQVYNLTDLKTVLLEANETGPGEEEEFALTLPESAIYLITVEDVDGNAGKYLLAIES